MKKFFLIVIGAVITLLAAAFAMVDRSKYNAAIESVIVSALKENQMIGTFSGFSAGLGGLRAENASVFFPNAFLSVAAQSLRISPNWFRLFALHAGGTVEAKAYRGTIAGNAEFGAMSGAGRASLAVQGMHLADHPQLAGLGITQGTLDLFVRDLIVSPSNPPSANVTLEMRDVAKPMKTLLSRKVTGFVVDLILPPVHALMLSSNAIVEENKIQLSSLALSSSLASISSAGSIEQDTHGRIKNLTLAGSVKLSEEGHAAIQGVLPLISSGTLDDTTRNFTYAVEGSPPRLRFRFAKLNS